MVEKPRTLGQHIRHRRLSLGKKQEDVARQLGTLREVYDRWERDERVPVVSEWPGIIGFLGYYPGRQESIGDLVLKARRLRGLSQTKMAASLGLDHARLRRWEHGSEVPSGGVFIRLKELVAAEAANLQAI